MFTSALAAIVLVIYVAVVLVTLLGAYELWRRVRNSGMINMPASLDAETKEVTILRPIKGVDSNLYECLRSSFLQTYPHEILFCVSDASDPAIGVVNTLLEEFPGSNSRVLVGDAVCGINPKINNLVKGFEAAKNDLIWVLDSNVWMPPETLAYAVTFFENPRISLVHHLPVAIALDTCRGSQLDEIYMSTVHAKFYLGINAVNVAPCVMGKSNLYRRSDLNRATESTGEPGIRQFGCYIAEDQLIAEKLWSNGGRTALAGHFAVQPLAGVTAREYFERRVRWQRVRKYMVVAATLTEPATDCFVCGLMGAAAGGRVLLGHFSYSWFFVHVVLWFLLDAWCHHNLVRRHSLTGIAATWTLPHRDISKLRQFAAFANTWFVREVTALPIWVYSMAGDRVRWRNKVFKIRRDLIAEEVG